MEVKKKEGRMEYWSIGVMEYWKDQKTGDRMKSTGIMECWKNGMMGERKSLPASLYEREETDRNGGRMENGGDPCKPGDS